MDKIIHDYPNKQAVELEESQEQSSNKVSSPRSNNSSQNSSVTADKRNKIRKKSKSDQNQRGSSNIWKNLSHIFAKPSSDTSDESTSVNLANDKNKASTFRRLSSIFKHQKSPDVIKHVANIGVSPTGYQAAISETNFKPSAKKEIAMAVRLPSGTKRENVAVTIELEAVRKGEESSSNENNDETMVMKCLKETESKTVFSGLLKVPPNTDFAKLANMPLYIMDSNEQLMFQPGAEISYRKVVKPSEDMLLKEDDGSLVNMGTIKIKVRFDKISELKKGIQLSISSINAEKDLINRSLDKNKVKKDKQKIAVTEVQTVNESETHMEDSMIKATDLGHFLNSSTMHGTGQIYEDGVNQADKYEVANAIVDGTLAVAAKSSKIIRMGVTENSQESVDSCNDMEKKDSSANENDSSENFSEDTIFGNERLVETSKTKTIRDNSTQYSNNYFTTDKEIDVQGSLMISNYGIFDKNYSYYSPVTSSSQILPCTLRLHSNLMNKIQQPSHSYESSETVMPDSTPSATTTEYSSTILSDTSTYCTYYDHDLKVPMNTPISSKDMHDHKNIECVPNVSDLSVSNPDMDEISNLTGNSVNTSQNSENTKQVTSNLFDMSSLNIVERVTLEEPQFISYSSTEEELYLMDFDESSKEEQKIEQNSKLDTKEDKTLELLEAVCLKLETYLGNTDSSHETDKKVQRKSLDLCGLFANLDRSSQLSKNIMNVRNVSVSCDNPFNSSQNNKEDINKRCYEDDDEYYESHRKDVRRYFQNDLGMLEGSDRIKKNFDFYLSGDNLITDTDFGSIAYQAYPLIMNNQPHIGSLNDQNQIKYKDSYTNTLQDFETIQATTLPSINTKINSSVRKPLPSKLETELDTLQQMYNNMRQHMKFLIDFDDAACSSDPIDDENSTIKSQTVYNISDGLTSSIHELKYCLSAINKMLVESTSSLQSISTALPSAFDLFPNTPKDVCVNSAEHSPVEQNGSSSELKDFPIGASQVLENSSTIFKNIDSIMPTIYEPLSTISDLLGGGLHQANQPPESTNIYTTSLTCKTCTSHVPKEIPNDLQLKLKKDISNEIKNVEALEQLPTISDSSKSSDTKPSEFLNHYQRIVPPDSSEADLFWDFSPKAKNVDGVMAAVSQPLSAVANFLCDTPPKGKNTTNDIYLSSSEKNNTYFAMESEIECTIKELLKESEYIKESIIMNGGKEDAEPPFFLEYIKNLIKEDSFVTCKKIVEDIVNTVPELEINSKNKPNEDVKYILDTLLEEIDKTENFLDDASPYTTNKCKKSLDAVNFLYDASYKVSGEMCANIQIGDANNQPTSSVYNNKHNECVTCFSSTTAFTPKILKTSFSFGETPDKCPQIPYSGCKTPVRRRDGLTITGQEKNELGQSRLFTELLNFQSDINSNEQNSNRKNHESEEEFSSAVDISEEFQEDAAVSKVSEYSTSLDNNNTELEEVSSYKPTHSLPMSQYKKSTTTSLTESEDNPENTESEENNPNPTTENDDNSIQQSVSNQGSNYTIPKTQKCLQLTNSTNNDPQNQPSTSKKPPKSTATTEEEELIQNVDLTQKNYDSSTEPEYFLPEKASGATQKSFYSQAQSSRVSRMCDSSSEEEIVRYSLRKPRSKKKKNAKILEIKPKTSLISESDSENFAKIKERTINSDQVLMSLNSHILLKPARAIVNLQEKINQSLTQEPSTNSPVEASLEKNETIKNTTTNISESSSKNESNASDTEYEADHETIQFRVPNPRHRYKSIQELNTPEEIDLIEQNVIENDGLERSTRKILVESDTSSQVEYEESSLVSENRSTSEFSVNSIQEDNEPSTVVNVDKVPTIQP